MAFDFRLASLLRLGEGAPKGRMRARGFSSQPTLLATDSSRPHPALRATFSRREKENAATCARRSRP